MAVLAGLRSALSLLLTLSLFVPWTVPFYLIVVPAAWLRPAWRPALVSRFMRAITRTLLWALSLGGARFRRRGALPTADPVLVVANHQSLLDILTVTMMAAPYVPAFVTRRRYERFIPLVSPCIRMLGCPIVDPGRDGSGSVRAVQAAARDLRHGMLIFPEGHRSTDGELRAFRTAGLRAILEERRLPIYLVVVDGMWRGRRLADFLFRIHELQGEAEVVGPLHPPERAEDVPEFVDGLRDRIGEKLRAMRQARAA